MPADEVRVDGDDDDAVVFGEPSQRVPMVGVTRERWQAMTAVIAAARETDRVWYDDGSTVSQAHRALVAQHNALDALAAVERGEGDD